MSRIGRLPITVPAGVDVSVDGATVSVFVSAVGCSSAPGAVSRRYGGTTPRPSLTGVGSKVIQPWFGKKISTHACASSVLITRWELSADATPAVKPIATLDGRPTTRAITAIAEAYCSQ